MQSSGAHGDIVSDTPGRLRIRLRPAHRHPERMEQARDHLQRQDAIDSVSTNGSTGSVTVRYDPGRTSAGEVLALLRDIGIIVRAAAQEVLPELPDESGGSTTALTLIAAVDDLDRRLSKATRRKVDLKLLFPTGLLALGLRQASTQGLGISTIPAYVLLWYAFDSFWKFHAGKPAAPGKTQGLGETPAPGPEAEQRGASNNQEGPKAA